MRYSYEYKLICIELYKEGRYPETPEGISQREFRKTIRRWVRIEESCGKEALKPKNIHKHWTPEEKYELVAEIIAGSSCKATALREGMNPGLLYQWVQKYKTMGYNGLINQKKGRPSTEPDMKKKAQPLPLTESEREELIRLRAENTYIKVENEVIKKRIALRKEKQAAQLKAKKQQSSKSSVKKDTN